MPHRKDWIMKSIKNGATDDGSEGTAQLNFSLLERKLWLWYGR
jgi:hypothetical protein